MTQLVDVKTALNTFFNFKFENILSDRAGPTDGLDSLFSVVNELLEQCIAIVKMFQAYYNRKWKIQGTIHLLLHTLRRVVFLIKCFFYIK